jgi:dolichol kinase
MTFWLVSFLILGAGLLFSYGSVTTTAYIWTLALLPPFLAGIENITPFGLDNITVPLTTLLILQAIAI